MSWGQPATPNPQGQASGWSNSIRYFGYAPGLFLVMLFSLKLGGPIGVMKVAFGSDPWSSVLVRKQSQSDDPEFRAQFEKMEETRLRDAKSKILLSIIFGGIFFFLSLGLFIWLFSLSTGQLRIIYSLGILLGIATLIFAFTIRNDPFGSG